MKFIRHATATERRYNCNVHFWKLEEDEYEWSDQHIITAADRHGDLTAAEWAECLEYDGADKGRHPGHFGGVVVRYPGCLNKDNVYVKVTVYID